MTLVEHLREQLIAAQVAEDERRVAELRAELDRVSGPSVREIR